MASQLDKIRQKIYDTNKNSRYLAMSNDELIRNLYQTEKFKNQFESFEEFEYYIK